MVKRKIKPEKLVEMDVLAYAFQQRWSLDVYDSEALFFGGKKRSNPGLKAGTPDIIGADSQGIALFLELKDPKKDHVCRLAQFQFLTLKIESNAFAIVVSSSEQLDRFYKTWMSLRKTSLDEARNYLKSILPKKVLVNNKIIKAPEI